MGSDAANEILEAAEAALAAERIPQTPPLYLASWQAALFANVDLDEYARRFGFDRVVVIGELDG